MMVTYETEYSIFHGMSMGAEMGHQATPEGLRAAAKLLEEKAKELDKPKFTPKQVAIINLARNTGFSIYHFKGDTHTKISSDVINAGESDWADTYFEVKSFLMSKDYYSGGPFATKIFKDNDGEVLVGLVWPNV